PLNLDGQSFLANQGTMSSNLVERLARELINFEMPNASTIFAGLDPAGCHIYTVHNNEANCVDNVGFAAIGIGDRHASSQFMFARHAWDSPFSDTLLLTYYAKRKAEVAPGVDTGTDMMMVGPTLGSLTLVGDHVIKKLDERISSGNRFESIRICAGKGRNEILC